MAATFNDIVWLAFATVCLQGDKLAVIAAEANTVCPKGSPRMNDAARLLMVDLHNVARSNMVKGKEAISASGALSPTGSNIGVYAGQLVYPAGTPCTVDLQCTTGVGDKCNVNEGLCLRGASTAAHLTCANVGGHTSTTVRTTMLDFHNNVRRELANGQTKNKTGLLPTGKNIYKLDYDCELEKTTLASFDCSAASGYSWNTREMTEAELLVWWKQNVQKQWDDVTLYGVDSRITPHANITNTWQRLATNRVIKMGCAMLRCPLQDGKYKVFWRCTLGAGANTALPAYTPGPVCQKDSDCTLLPKSVCLVDEGMCRSEAVYPAPGVSTMCPSASNRLDDASRLRLLDLHNHRRSELIHGREEMGNTYTFAPTGSNMYKMVWDCAAEAKSQAHIEDAVGRIPHSTNEYRTYSGDLYGESLSMSPANRPVRDAVEWAIKWWWGELAESGWYGAANHTLTGADMDDTEQHQTIGHWSNAAWAKTFKLGCGVSKAGANVCCQYGPSGNYVNPGMNVVYPPGKPCVNDADCTRSPLDKCNVADGLCLHA